MKIGIIGAGNIGAMLARKFTSAGHEVRIANSRGPQSLVEVAAETGARPATIAEAVADAEAVILALPYKAIRQLPADLFSSCSANLAIIDTGNYYPMRDGSIPGLDGEVAETEWVSRYFHRPVVKAFNSISANSLRRKGASRSELRIALPVSGDDQKTKRIACTLVEDAGFAAVDAGSIAESWRQQPGTSIYTTDLGEDDLRHALADIGPEHRSNLPERRESNLKMILALEDGPGSEAAVRALREVWGLAEQQ